MVSSKQFQEIGKPAGDTTGGTDTDKKYLEGLTKCGVHAAPHNLKIITVKQALAQLYHFLVCVFYPRNILFLF